MLNMLIIKEMQIKNHNELSLHTCQNGYHQKDHKSRCWRVCWGKGILIHCGLEYELVQPQYGGKWKAIWRLLRKLKTELPYDPTIPLLGIQLKKIKTQIWKDQMFIGCLYILNIINNAAECPLTDEWIKRIRYIYTTKYSVQFSLVQSLSRVQLFATPWIAARQASLSITNSWSLLKPMSIESVMPSSTVKKEILSFIKMWY